MKRNDKIEDLLAFAVVELGLSPDEFYELTPSQYHKMLKFWRKKQQREDDRVGRLCLVIASLLSKSKKKLRMSDFTPDWGIKKNLISEEDTNKVLNKIKQFSKTYNQ